MCSNAFFLSCGSFLETNILLTSISFIWSSFCFCKSHFFQFFCRQNLVHLSTNSVESTSFYQFLYKVKKKSKFVIIIIWVYVHWLYIFALCLLVWLKITIKHKNIYSHNTLLWYKQCLCGVCMIFINIVTFKNYC